MASDRGSLIEILHRPNSGITVNVTRPQGKIERWHQTLKNRILLENYFLPGDFEASIEPLEEHYKHHCFHESLVSLTLVDVYTGRAQAILLKRKKIKRRTIEQRRLQHHQCAA
jgi:transposase InsO family protein